MLCVISGLARQRTHDEASYQYKITSLCFYHLRRLRQLRDKVSQDSTRQLVTSLVLSRIDYCNIVLAVLPASTIAPLQHVQNSAARLVLRLDRRSHITTAALHELHWLPVKYRIQYKTAAFMHQVTAQRCLSYVADLVVFCSSNSQSLSDDFCARHLLVQPSFNEHALISDDV